MEYAFSTSWDAYTTIGPVKSQMKSEYIPAVSGRTMAWYAWLSVLHIYIYIY